MAYDEKIKKKIQKLYENGESFDGIFNKYGVAINTVKYWVYKHKWKRKNHIKKPTKTKRKMNVFCVGKLQNTNAVKHGLFAKYLPKETLELVGAIETMSPLDILWENICLKYAAIIRSQQIMYVKDNNDVTKRITVDGSETTVYQYKEAYEKQASFLMAQSRAMGTLMNLIKQYEEMCNSELATEEQKLRIEKLKKEIAKDDTQETLMEDDGFTKAIENATKEVWRDD
ncbi:hypothetical protein [Megamonas funiformis]|uniref:hypothetical protein n=1 Tax=Megamonas funiformis TaxID=437897 RepID=UPI00265E61B9|nr:hypothetical protein [Megamonas funiformis]